MYKIAISAVFFLLSCNANALFVVNYQGLNKEGFSSKVAPYGYKVLADRTFKTVRYIGEGKAEVRHGHGFHMSIKDAMMDILPKDWIAYIEKNIKFDKSVDWDGDSEWTNVLLSLGNNYGLAFIVDWEQKVVQVIPGIDAQEDSRVSKVKVTDPNSGRSIYIRSKTQQGESGEFIVNGKKYPVKISKE